MTLGPDCSGCYLQKETGRPRKGRLDWQLPWFLGQPKVLSFQDR